MIPEKYSDLYGEGRIKIINSSAEVTEDTESYTDADSDNAAIDDTAEDVAENTDVTAEGNPSTGAGITVIVPAIFLMAAVVSRKKK